MVQLLLCDWRTEHRTWLTCQPYLEGWREKSGEDCEGALCRASLSEGQQHAVGTHHPFSSSKQDRPWPFSSQMVAHTALLGAPGAGDGEVGL